MRGRGVQEDERNRLFLKVLGEIEKDVERQQYKCLFPRCGETAVQCHSQQREGQLRAISENGVVCAPSWNIYRMLKYRILKKADTELRPHYNRIGISKASVFQGYCATHDKQLFHPIESETLKPSNSDHAFSLYLRAVSYEFCRKRRGHFRNTETLKKCKGVFDQEKLHYLELIKWGMELYLRRDGARYLSEAFRMYRDGNTSELITRWKAVPRNLLVSTCICANPMLEAYGSDTSDLRVDRVQPNLTFNIVPNENGTHIVASWLPEHDSSCAWVQEAFQSKDGLEMLVNRLAFGESEETCVNPPFWDSLPSELKDAALETLRHSHVSFEPLKPVPTLLHL